MFFELSNVSLTYFNVFDVHSSLLTIGGLMFCGGFVALCGAISPRCLGRSPWNFHTWLEVWALRLRRSQSWGLPQKMFWG